MSRVLIPLLGLLLLTGIAHAESETADFARYQPIIDRSPFGAMSSADPGIGPNWIARWQFVALVVSNSGNGPVQAVLFDKESNRSHFRAEGEAIDSNIKVQKIDQKPPKVVLLSGLEAGTLTFSDRPAMAAAPGTPAPTAPSAVRRIPFRRGN